MLAWEICHVSVLFTSDLNMFIETSANFYLPGGKVVIKGEGVL